MTEQPKETDVLLGRGLGIYRHPGNQRFRLIVKEYVEAYMISTKKQKMKITQSVVDRIRKEFHTRFLKKCIVSNLWVEVDEERVLEKTAQALRNAATPLKKNPFEESLMKMLIEDSNGTFSKGVSSEKPLLQNQTKNMCGASEQKKLIRAVADQIISKKTLRLRFTSSSDSPRQEKFQSDQDISTTAQRQIQKLQGMNRFHYSPNMTTSSTSMGVYFTLIPRPTKFWQRAMNANCTLRTASLHPAQATATASSPTLGGHHEPARVPMALCEMRSTAPAVVVAGEKDAFDDDEFRREVGPDEPFLGLCTSDPVGDIDANALFDNGS
mmetsp:Transcript_24455/g.41875  ORF Transcript_24455/g.41875 Transcript_24455/m.41875 type:complete len:325 (+) Transcript_24455:173-1147(+)|eukprot:CAMPEP_0183766286 /NCGR_PEP_ID=MMETSP0739-20130205/11470_1 /TAXON_ID=385413 /ORGANISM="Thalassiosira miniscula, Strain CCMP1093" /LENGTH=324 /DNA_ID=CAMNT_0026005049 /DNA_START=167 /DNA_END=1141 /DNA_ORIENTATION=+